MTACDDRNQSPMLLLKRINDSDKVGADVVLLHGCPQSCISNPVEGLLEEYEDTVEILLMLKLFLTENT